MGTFLLLVPVKETLVSEELVELLVVLSHPYSPEDFILFLPGLMRGCQSLQNPQCECWENNLQR